MRTSTLVVEDGSDPEENGSNQIGRDGVQAEDVERSNVAGGDISQTTVNYGVDPEEHAKLLSRVARLESSASKSIDLDIAETEEEKGELEPIRETEFYKRWIGQWTRATSFSMMMIILGIFFFGYAMEYPSATDLEIEGCAEGTIQPAQPCCCCWPF